MDAGEELDGDSELERRCRAHLDDVFPERPRSLLEACQGLERRRGRPVRVVVSDPGVRRLPVGLWVHGPTAETVWIDARTSGLHQLVIIGHELGHMICGHRPTPLGLSGSTEFASREDLATLTMLPADGLAARRCMDAGDPAERRREAEAERTGRMLVRPFLDGYDAELSALFR